MTRKFTMYLSEAEFNRGEVLRSYIRVMNFYRVGDIRKAIDKYSGYSFGVKVRITAIQHPSQNNTDPKHPKNPFSQKSKIIFTKIRELEL